MADKFEILGVAGVPAIIGLMLFYFIIYPKMKAKRAGK